MNIKMLICSILAILFGILMVVYGGIDDSPGGQLLGILVAITGIVGTVKSTRKNSTK
jgi:drug/metabolite transporter (DMT)-like permease